MLKWAHLTKFKNRKAIICDGSVRSGKTVSMILGFVHWAMRFFDGKNFGICGKTISSTERNIILPLLNMPDITDYYSLQYIRGENKRIIIRSGSHTNTFFIFGGKDESSYTLVQGITLSGVLFDEVALMPKSFVDQAVARTLSEPEARYWFNCNPESAEHWFYKEWICNTRQKKALHLHFTMQDNPILSPEQIADAERLYTGVFYNRYIKGLWCVAEGLIYPMFDKAVHVKSLPHPQGEWYVSVDYGTLNAFSAGLWCYDGTTAYRVAEYYYSGREQKRQRTNTQYLQSIQQLTAGKSISAVIVDPSAASFIAELRRQAFWCEKEKMMWSRASGERRLLWNKESCCFLRIAKTAFGSSPFIAGTNPAAKTALLKKMTMPWMTSVILYPPSCESSQNQPELENFNRKEGT